MSFALATSAAYAVGAKRAPVAGARLGKSAHIPRRAMQSSVTRAAVGADEGAAIKPFEVRTRRRITRALVKLRHAAPPPAPIVSASNGDAFVPGRLSSSHPNCAFRARKNISAGGFLFVGFLSANPNLSAERDKLSVRMTRARVHDTTLARANAD